MRNLILLGALGLSFAVTALGSQVSAQASAQGPAPVPWRQSRRDMPIPMRDGEQLLADLYLPERAGRYPTVLIQTPYDKFNLGAPISGELEEASEIGEVGRGAVSDTLGLLDRQHYAYVVVDWRGFHANKSAMRGTGRGWRRGLDGYDCVEWIAKQSWSDGKVGTWGGSALGKVQFQTALEHPPHLVCCVPLIAAMGFTYGQFYENGVPADAHLKLLDFLGFKLRDRIRKNPVPGTLGWRIVERRSYRPHAIEVPCLMISGWWDHYPDLVIKTFEDIRSRGGEAARQHSRLLLGPWDHVGVGLRAQGDLDFPKAELASARAAKAFFDFHLRGVKNGFDATARIRYFDSGSMEWRSASQWAGRKSRVTTLRLLADGSMRPRVAAASEGSGQESGERSYRYDPQHPPRTRGGRNLPPLPHGPRRINALLGRDDLLVYRTVALDAPLRLEGNAALEFSFRSNRVDCDFCLLLCDVDPQGNAHLLGETALRARLRNRKEELLEPGEEYRVTVPFSVHCHTFQPGHRVLLVVASGSSPRYERNTHDGSALWQPRQALTLDVVIRHGPGSPALLRLPRPARSGF